MIASKEQVDDFLDGVQPFLDDARRLGLNVVVVAHSQDHVVKGDYIDYATTGSWPMSMGLVEWLRNELTRNS